MHGCKDLKQYRAFHQASNIGIPPGLEYLSLIDNLQIEQNVSLLEAITGWDTNNKYVIKCIMHLRRQVLVCVFAADLDVHLQFILWII